MGGRSDLSGAKRQFSAEVVEAVSGAITNHGGIDLFGAKDALDAPISAHRGRSDLSGAKRQHSAEVVQAVSRVNTNHGGVDLVGAKQAQVAPISEQNEVERSFSRVTTHRGQSDLSGAKRQYSAEVVEAVSGIGTNHGDVDMFGAKQHHFQEVESDFLSRVNADQAGVDLLLTKQPCSREVSNMPDPKNTQELRVPSAPSTTLPLKRQAAEPKCDSNVANAGLPPAKRSRFRLGSWMTSLFPLRLPWSGSKKSAKDSFPLQATKESSKTSRPSIGMTRKIEMDTMGLQEMGEQLLTFRETEEH